MALFRISKGNEINLPAQKREGFAYFTIDESDFYIDTESSTVNATTGAIEGGKRQQLNAHRARYLKSKDVNQDNEHDLYVDDEEISLGRKAGESNYEDPYSGDSTKAGLRSIAVGTLASATGNYSSSFGNGTMARGASSHAEGVGSAAQGEGAHAEGNSTQANGYASHAEGVGAYANGQGSHAEGHGQTGLDATYAHAEGNSTQANGLYSHAEGNNTVATGDNSHAEGRLTLSQGQVSHAEGKSTEAIGDYSHAEGLLTHALGESSHAEGDGVSAIGDHSHAEGFITQANGRATHSEGFNTIADGDDQHVQGKYNIADTVSAHIVGNGSYENGRSNAHTLDWNGNAWFAGDVYIGSTSGTNKEEGSKKLATEEYVDEAGGGNLDFEYGTARLPKPIKSTKVICAEDTFFAVSFKENDIYRSNDGIHWEVVPTTGSEDGWDSIAYGNNTLVVTSLQGAFAYSEDFGATWTLGQLPTPANLCWEDTIYAGGNFVIVGYDQTTSLYSPDGHTWNMASMPSASSWHTLCHGIVDGIDRIVVLTEGRKAACSADGGRTWIATEMPSGHYWGCIAFGDGKFVAFTDDVDFAYSYDGINWTQVYHPDEHVGNFYCMTYGSGKFVVISATIHDGVIRPGLYFSMYSTDGINWTKTEELPDEFASWSYLAYGNNRFVTVAAEYSDLVDNVAISRDGIHWAHIVRDFLDKEGHAITEEVKRAVADSFLPATTSDDNGKFLRIVDGAPAWATVQNIEEVEM